MQLHRPRSSTERHQSTSPLTSRAIGCRRSPGKSAPACSPFLTSTPGIATAFLKDRNIQSIWVSFLYTRISGSTFQRADGTILEICHCSTANHCTTLWRLPTATQAPPNTPTQALPSLPGGLGILPHKHQALCLHPQLISPADPKSTGKWCTFWSCCGAATAVRSPVARVPAPS